MKHPTLDDSWRWATSACAAVFVAALAPVAAAQAATQATAAPQDRTANWPNWRGPNHDGVSRAKGLADQGKPEPLWFTNVGNGYSCASIVDGKLYTIGHDPEKQRDTVFCLDAKTGFDVWTYDFPSATMARMHGGGSQSTVTVDGDAVFVTNREGKSFCLDAAAGTLRWTRDLAKDHGLRVSRWGFSASPYLLGNRVIVNADRTLALDKKTGKTLWKTKNYGDSYATPSVVEVDGHPCLAVFNATGLILLDPDSGAELAVHDWNMRRGVNAATPVSIGNKLFISSGYNKGGAMLEASTDKLKLLWESKVMRTQMSGCVLFENHLYGFDESTMKCLDLDGNVQWAKRGYGKGAFMIADGKLVILSSRGDLVIAEAKPTGFRELSRTHVLDDGVYWTSPTVWNGLIYCRNSLGDLVCIDHRESK